MVGMKAGLWVMSAWLAASLSWPAQAALPALKPQWPVRTIRLCMDPDWYPFEAISPGGQAIGIAPELWQRIEQASGLHFAVVPSQSWDASLKLAKGGQCDVISLLNATPERQQWLHFTDAYLVDPNVFITRDEHPYIATPQELDGQLLALPAGTSIEERLRHDYPNIRILRVADEQAALAAVEHRQAQATLRSRIMAAYIINSHGWFNLKIAGEIPAYANALRMGVVHDDPVLLQRLNQGIAALNQDDRNRALNRHIPLVVAATDYTLALLALACLGMAMVAFAYWSRKIRRINGELRRSEQHIALQLDQLSRVERELRLSRERYKLLVEQLQESIVVVRGRRLLFFNPAFCVLTGYDAQSLAHLDTATLFFAEEREAIYQRAQEQLSGVAPEQRHVFRLRNRLGLAVWVEAQIRAIEWEGEMAILNTLSDVTQRVEHEAEMRHLATHDPLTGLPNRDMLKQRLRDAIGFARDTQQKLALLFVDLDRFKPVNDNHGHEAGDQVLRTIAQRLQGALRESDLVARWGGDEFIVVLENVNTSATIERIARKLLAAISLPIALHDAQQVTLSCSIGIAVYPDHGEQGDELISKSDAMMYKAKKQGSGCILFFAPVVPQSGSSLFRLMWSRELECGNADIDREHEQLFELANRLLGSVVGGRFSSETEPCLLQLLAHTKGHFKHEMTLLMRLRYPDAFGHDAIHKQLLQKASELHARYLRGELDPLVLIHFIVYEIIDQHMMVEDRKWFGFLHASSQV